MKKLLNLALLFVFVIGFGQEVPKDVKTKFTEEVLSQKIMSQNGKKVKISEVLKKYEGKILVIDFWASWCRDCILALPKAKELRKENPDVHFVYFSLDRSHAQWLRGLEKYNIKDNENYWFDEGWKNKFNNYIDLNWVPRFMVIDQTGKIAKYYSISPEDPELVKVIKELQNK